MPNVIVIYHDIGNMYLTNIGLSHYCERKVQDTRGIMLRDCCGKGSFLGQLKLFGGPNLTRGSSSVDCNGRVL